MKKKKLAKKSKYEIEYIGLELSIHDKQWIEWMGYLDDILKSHAGINKKYFGQHEKSSRNNRKPKH